MSFDGLFLHYMTAELSEQLTGGRIQKINQVFEHELVLQIRSNQRSHKLLLSAHPTFGRVQLTQTTFASPKTPSTFTMILRKYLNGAFIEKIHQVDNDRQIIFEISAKNEIGDQMKIALIVEIMGKHSNILLMDTESNKILESVKHVGFSQNQYRTILPGSTYIAPPSDEKLNPFTTSDEKLFEILQTETSLQQVFQGLGRDSATALTGLSLADFKSVLTTVRPSLYPNDTFSAIQLSDDCLAFETLSELLDAYYLNKAERDRVRQIASQVIRRVAGELDKNRKKLKKQRQELQATDKAEGFRQKGELLTTFLHQIPNNKTSVTLDNYYTNQPLNITLNPALTPNQNAQKYFHKYGKLKQAVKFLGEQIAKTQQTIAYLESVETALEQASVSEIADIKEELIQTGFIKAKYRKNKQQKLLPPEKYQATDGTLILVGKNNLQNEQVSFKLARKGDLWFHAKDLPGSHVIITGNPTPSDETITEAAELAAYFSKARLSNLVQVDMIEAKKLHKPTGTPPGFVTYVGQKTLRVTADEAKIRAMKR
ncbi:MAG: NFACT family protein [Streptococcaceae bacterium]|jgi:predicted ribosome quality control (RQC) complex YloA/Tae2 family protein|nr:NFACT family protein [Streptococcaceae bacterium]